MTHTLSIALAAPVDKTYTYSCKPEQSVQRGDIVKVPLGPRSITGFVLSVSTDTLKKDFEIKPIHKILVNCTLPENLMLLGEWISKYYFCPIGLVFDSFIPPAVKKGDFKFFYEEIIKIKKEDIVKYLSEIPASHKKRKILANILASANSFSRTNLNDRIKKITQKPNSNVSKKDLEWFISKDLIEIEKIQINRVSKNYGLYKNITDSTKLTLPNLTEHQKTAVNQICAAIEDISSKKNFLLHGVTGSGKTEVYLRSVQKALSLNKTAIVLVPEISLTPQMISQFTQRLGKNVAILHSRLSDGERFDEWQRIKNNQAKVILGARSAIFAPLTNPGLIILDEEHEFTYKQGSAPLYHATETALKRLEISKGVLILGSATPRLESFKKAVENKYKLLSLPERINKKPLPPVEIIDMRLEFKNKNFSLFSKRLQNEIKKTIRAGKKIIILLNRRGHSSFVFCRECGESIKCKHCSVSLKYHQDSPRLKCHYCDAEQPLPKICPSCGSRYIKYFGAGTQKAVSEFKRLFPECPCFRMDSDTTTRKGAHSTILDSFKSCFPAALIGTQMIAKGLDIHDVTLVGILSADQIMNLPDFRASEKAFQLITQVAGRAGRGEDTGRVLVQSYDCENPVLKLAALQDYQGFYDYEMQDRKSLFYPPFTHMARIIFSGKDAKIVEEHCFHFIKNLLSFQDFYMVSLNKIKKEKITDQTIIYIPPATCPIEVIRNTHRWQIIMMCKDINTLQKLLLKEKSSSKPSSKVKKIIDIDTANTM